MKFYYICADIYYLMKKVHIILIALLSLILSAGCAHVGQVEVQDFKIRSFSPESLNNISLGVELKINNEGPAVGIKNMSGLVYYDGKVLGSFESAEFSIPGKTTEWVPISGNVAIDQSASIVSLLEIVQNFDSEKVAVSFDAEANVGAIKKKFHQEMMPVSQLMAKIKK